MPGHPAPRFALRACPVRERRSALAALQARHPALPEQHPARPERHLAKPAQQLQADCPGAVRDASGVAAFLRPRAVGAEEVYRRRPAVLEAQFESVVPRGAASGQVRSSPAARACRRAQPSARRAQARLQPVVLAQLAVSQPRAASWCAAVPGAWPAGAAEGARQPEALAVAAEPRQGAVAVRGGAAAERQPAARAAAVALRRAVVQDVAAAGLQPEAAPGAAGVRQREARGEALAARPSAAAWAAPLCLQAAARPGPSASARFARAMRGLRIALP
jgi:hypothetical protein